MSRITYTKKAVTVNPSLGEIITQLTDTTASVKSEINDQVIIKYDKSSAIAQRVDRKRFQLGDMFGTSSAAEYYRVDTYQGKSKKSNQIFKVKHPDFPELEFSIDYNICAIPGGEVALVEALARRDSLSQMFNNYLDNWIDQGLSENAGLIFSNFDNFASIFEKRLVKSGADIGLKIEAIITLTNKPQLKDTIQIELQEITVQPKGYNDFIKISFDAVLVPNKQQDSETLVLLGFQAQDEIRQLLKTWTQDCIRESITYNDISESLHFKVRTSLKEYWNYKLLQAQKGWNVADLVLQSADVPPSNFKFEKIEIETALKNAKIPLVSTIMLNLEDAEKFKNSRISNLELWIREKLQQTAQNILAKVSYAELVSSIEELGSIIKSNLDRQALAIGYRVEYLLTSELVDRNKLNFQFQFNEEEQSFRTTLGDQITLNINITGRIQSLNHDTWRSTLTPVTDFVDDIKKEVLQTVRILLAQIDADDFYTRFNDIVVPKLVHEIKALLIGKFNVDPSMDISPQMGKSALRDLIVELQRGVQKVKVSCLEGVASFSVSFSVVSVDPQLWRLFANRNYTTADQVKETISDRIRISIEQFVREKITDISVLSDPRIRNVIHKVAEDANHIIREKLGVIIDIIDVDQTENIIANTQASKNYQHALSRMTMLLDAIKKVDDDIIIAMINGSEDWELTEFEHKKTKLIGMLENEKFSYNKLADGLDKPDLNYLLSKKSPIENLDQNVDINKS